MSPSIYLMNVVTYAGILDACNCLTPNANANDSYSPPTPKPFYTLAAILSYNISLIFLKNFKITFTLSQYNFFILQTLLTITLPPCHNTYIQPHMTTIMEPTTLPSTTHGISSSTEERALALLGQGISAEATAAACGVSVSRISQLLSSTDFANAVASLRYEALQKHNAQDSEYDQIEVELTKKFKESIPLMMRPMEILKGLQVINAQKRRGSSAPEAILETQQVVNITLPSVIINNFTNQQLTTNIHNQVIKVDDVDLITMQSSTLLSVHKVAVEQKAQLTDESNSSASADPSASKPTNRYEDI